MASDTEDPNDSPVMKEAFSMLFTEIIEDITLEICFKVHRSLKFGYFTFDENTIQEGESILDDATSANDNQLCNFLALAASSKKPSHTNCPHCKRKVGTFRFTLHLSLCMGVGGRQSRNRNAKRKSQTYENGDDDEDYSESGKKKKEKAGKFFIKVYKSKGKTEKKKAGRNSRKVKKFKGKTGKDFIKSFDEAVCDQTETISAIEEPPVISGFLDPVISGTSELVMRSPLGYPTQGLPLFTPSTALSQLPPDPHLSISMEVLACIIHEMNQVMKNDISKTMVESTAFKRLEQWWDEHFHQEKPKTTRNVAVKTPENAQTAAASSLTVLFDQNRSAFDFGSEIAGFGLGLRPTSVRMASFRKRVIKATSSLPLDYDDSEKAEEFGKDCIKSFDEAVSDRTRPIPASEEPPVISGTSELIMRPPPGYPTQGPPLLTSSIAFPQLPSDSHLYISMEVLACIIHEMKQVMKNDISKTMVESTAFKRFEQWWNEHLQQEKPKTTGNVAVKTPENAQTAAASSLTVLFDQNRSAFDFGSEIAGFGLGLRPTSVRMASFRKRVIKATSPPPLDYDDSKNAEESGSLLDRHHTANKLLKEKPSILMCQKEVYVILHRIPQTLLKYYNCLPTGSLLDQHHTVKELLKEKPSTQKEVCVVLHRISQTVLKDYNCLPTGSCSQEIRNRSPGHVGI